MSSADECSKFVQGNYRTERIFYRFIPIIKENDTQISSPIGRVGWFSQYTRGQ